MIILNQLPTASETTIASTIPTTPKALPIVNANKGPPTEVTTCPQKFHSNDPLPTARTYAGAEKILTSQAAHNSGAKVTNNQSKRPSQIIETIGDMRAAPPKRIDPMKTAAEKDLRYSFASVSWD
jgi:hypothetical protein